MSKENRNRRERETLVVMQDRGAEVQSLASSEIWQAVLDRIPLEDDELAELSSGTRGLADWRWRTENLSKAGWIHRDPSGNGLWTLTPAGREALERFPDPDALDTESQQLADAARIRLAATREERLASEVVPNDSKQERVIATARLFIEAGLKSGESVFMPGRTIWTVENVREFRSRLESTASTEGTSFEERLSAQLSDASDDVRLLAAELVTLQFLPISGAIGEIKKAARANRVLGLMDRPVEIPQVVSAAFGAGAFNPGPAMMNNLGGALRIIAGVVEAWFGLTEEDQEHLLEDPLAWRQLVRSAPGDPFPSQRNSLIYLVHPYFFGPIVSEDNKRDIRAAFAGEIPALTEDLEQDVRGITVALQVKNQRPVDFYREPLRTRWQPQKTDILSDEPVVVVDEPSEKSLGDLAAALHLDPQWLESTVALIRERKQVIFTGPPGTGKTYLASRIARFLAPRDDAFEIVQFHPSYSYEDFFEGYRPGRGGAFELQGGPLRRLADRARQNPEYPYVLLIDEINRGNLSKIFGELYFLLEYRDDAITLLYSSSTDGDEPTRFTLPSNVVIIGTMNTADRSIALLDAAMRRRFAFVELHPDRAPVREMFPAWLSGRPMEHELAGLLPALNALIPDDAFKIGPSYFMRQDMTTERLTTIWRYDILPLLSELHYGDGTDVEARYGLGKLLTSAQAPVDDLPPQAGA